MHSKIPEQNRSYPADTLARFRMLCEVLESGDQFERPATHSEQLHRADDHNPAALQPTS